MANKLILNSNTRLIDLLSEYPWLRQALTEVNIKFKMLNTPLGKVMANKATIAEMSKRSGIDESVLIEKLQVLICEQQSDLLSRITEG